MKLIVVFLSAFTIAATVETEKCKVISSRMVCRDVGEDDLPKTAYPDITWLSIFKSKVPKIKASMLKNLPKITDFHAEGVEIEKIEDNAFKGLKNLNWIDVSTNKIKTISPNLVEGLSIDHFNISHNQGLVIPERKPFLISEKLRWLDMQDCEITTVYSETFRSLPGLRDLSLARNKLKTLPDDIFQHNRGILSLDITGNKIKVLSDQVFLNLRTIVARFEDNPWVCDCNLAPLLSWSKRNVIKGEVKCEQPAGKKWKEIDLAHCQKKPIK